MINKFKNFYSFKKVLFVLTTISSFLLTLLNSSRIFSLWDFSNYTDIGTRLINGQFPYLDFPLYTQPGSFVEIAVFIWLFGNNLWSIYFLILIKIIIYSFIWVKILDQFMIKPIIYWPLLIVISFTSPWFVVPQPTYDADLALAIIICFYILFNFENFNVKSQLLITCVAIFFPFWYKQTSGLFWLTAVTFYLIFKKKYYQVLVSYIFLLLVLFATTMLISNKIIFQWFKNTFTRPISVRLNDGRNFYTLFNDVIYIFNFLWPVILFYLAIFISSIILKNKKFYRYLIFYSPVILFLRIILNFNFNNNNFNWEIILEAIIIWNLIIIFINYFIFGWKEKIVFLQTLIFVSCFTNSLSQGISGSSYAFWSLYLLIYLLNFNLLIKRNSDNANNLFINSNPIFLSSLILYLPILIYGLSLERMNFLRFEEKIQRYSNLYLWIGTPGEYLKESQIGISLFEKYRLMGKTAVWPGEDPVSFFSTKVPDINVSVSDATTNPEYDSIEKWLEENQIIYVILKTRLQLPGLHQISIDKFAIAKNGFNEIEKKGVYVVLKRKAPIIE